MMKRFIITMLLLATVLTMPTLVFAQSATGKIDLNAKLTTVGTGVGYSGTQSLASIVGLVIKALISIVGVLFMIYAVYAGYLWLTARGNEENVTKAKDILRGSVIGIIIVLAAYVITSFVVSRITTATGYNVQNTGTQTTPLGPNGCPNGLDAC